ncbi:CPBP family intramembrane glutamic endopeptidase, partial [Dokdonella sp.]|uniref:CPBP family intramembrane glutamic endopeptidase n=1 Tax=Dokdonella sp. TaxID=2291710 RepID=UPI0027BA6B34
RELAGVPHEPRGMPSSQLPWMLLAGSIAAPIYEEYLFRAWALERYRRALPAWLALALSSFWFVLPHAPGNLADAGMLFGGGIVLGLLWLRTRSLPACIIAHGLYNSFQIIGRWYLLP